MDLGEPQAALPGSSPCSSARKRRATAVGLPERRCSRPARGRHGRGWGATAVPGRALGPARSPAPRRPRAGGTGRGARPAGAGGAAAPRWTGGASAPRPASGPAPPPGPAAGRPRSAPRRRSGAGRAAVPRHSRPRFRGPAGRGRPADLRPSGRRRRAAGGPPWQGVEALPRRSVGLGAERSRGSPVTRAVARAIAHSGSPPLSSAIAASVDTGTPVRPAADSTRTVELGPSGSRRTTWSGAKNSAWGSLPWRGRRPAATTATRSRIAGRVSTSSRSVRVSWSSHCHSPTTTATVLWTGAREHRPPRRPARRPAWSAAAPRPCVAGRPRGVRRHQLPPAGPCRGGSRAGRPPRRTARSPRREPGRTARGGPAAGPGPAHRRGATRRDPARRRRRAGPGRTGGLDRPGKDVAPLRGEVGRQLLLDPGGQGGHHVRSGLHAQRPPRRRRDHRGRPSRPARPS